jgi:hypothetical protein
MKILRNHKSAIVLPREACPPQQPLTAFIFTRAALAITSKHWLGSNQFRFKPVSWLCSFDFHRLSIRLTSSGVEAVPATSKIDT